MNNGFNEKGFGNFNEENETDYSNGFHSADQGNDYEPAQADVQYQWQPVEPASETAEETTAVHIDLSAGEDTHSEPADEIPALVRKAPYQEHVKHNKKEKKDRKGRRWIAAAVALTVINFSIMGGMYALGRVSGSNSQVASNKSALVDSLQSDSGGSGSGESHAVATASSSTEMSTIDVAKKVGPAVVGITSTIQGQMSLFGGYATSQSEGSGIILSADGYIVTNNHVIDGASTVTVTLNTGTEYSAQIIGTDAETDLAVIKIEPTETLTVATLGDSSAVEVGETAIAIGNPMGLEFLGSVTEGIVSAVNRNIEVDGRTMNVIQTDAAINSGNSGGALVNSSGEVIGINSVKVSYEGVEGMGFAIPISEAKPIISDLLEFGYVKGRPLIGISTRDVSEYMAQTYHWPQGAQVMEVTSEAAMNAGLEQGDIITKVDGTEITTGEELTQIKDTHSPGDVLTLEVYKYATGRTETVQVTLQEQLPG